MTLTFSFLDLKVAVLKTVGNTVVIDFVIESARPRFERFIRDGVALPQYQAPPAGSGDPMAFLKAVEGAARAMFGLDAVWGP